MTNFTVLNFTVEISEEEVTRYKDTYYEDTAWQSVAVLYCNGEEIWRDRSGQYIDTYGSGGQTAQDVVIDMLRKVLNEPEGVH